jgi:hypothetical protein
MNTIKTHSLVALLAAALLATCAHRPYGTRPSYDSLKLPPIPATLPTFSASPATPMTPADADRLATRIGSYAGIALRRIESPERNDRIALFRGDDPSAVLTVDLTRGDFVFNAGLAAYQTEADTAGLPGKEEAVQLAQSHLERLGFAIPASEAFVANVGGLNMAVRRDDGTTGDFKKLVTVRFDRRLAGLPVIGDSRAVVQIGQRGALAGLVWDWLSVRGSEARRTEIVAEPRLRTTIEQRLTAESEGAVRIAIERADLILYDDGRTIEPAVRVVAQRTFRVTLADGKGEREYTVPWDTIAPLLAQPRAVYPEQKGIEARRLVDRDRSSSAKPYDTPNDDEPRAKNPYN